jgi:hypothetical protein
MAPEHTHVRTPSAPLRGGWLTWFTWFTWMAGRKWDRNAAATISYSCSCRGTSEHTCTYHGTYTYTCSTYVRTRVRTMVRTYLGTYVRTYVPIGTYGRTYHGVVHVYSSTILVPSGTCVQLHVYVPCTTLSQKQLEILGNIAGATGTLVGVVSIEDITVYYS